MAGQSELIGTECEDELLKYALEPRKRLCQMKASLNTRALRLIEIALRGLPAQAAAASNTRRVLVSAPLGPKTGHTTEQIHDSMSATKSD